MGAAGGGGEATVVQLEDAVKLLVEHLVRPVLPRAAIRQESDLAPEQQAVVAQQIHTAVVLYNYYHRKLFPQLAFADAKRFFMCSSLSVGEDLLVYLNMVHERDNNSGGDVELSVTDRAAMDACEIAKALDASKDSPDMTMWPISKVAVLLLNPTRKQCLVERGFNTRGVWSIVEKEFDAVDGNSRSSNQPTVQESTNNATSGALDGPFMLQQLAFSEVERKTGMKRSNLRILDEDLTYSLSKKRTTTKLFIVEYEQKVKSNFVEMPLEDLINRMTGPIFKNDQFPITSTVVDYYHILPYKEIVFECLHRKWPSDSSLKVQSHPHGKCSFHMEIDENLEEQEANSMSKMKKTATKVSTLKKNKQKIKAIGNSSNNNCSTSKHSKNNNVNSKRKSEAFRATTVDYTEVQDGESPTKENESPVIAGVDTLKVTTSPMNAKVTSATTGGTIVLEHGVQVDKNRAEKHSFCRNTPQDVFTMKAPWVDPVMKNGALEGQKAKDSEKSGGVAKNMNDQVYASLQPLLKMRDDVLHEQCKLEEHSAQCELDIQKILNEGGEMTPEVKSILEKYNYTSSYMMDVAKSSCSEEGSQTMKLKRKKLTETTLLRNKCQELDEICRENNWILPRYKVVPSVADEMFKATVFLTYPDSMSADGDLKTTPREARGSAAASMIFELHKKVKAEQQNTDAKLPK